MRISTDDASGTVSSAVWEESIKGSQVWTDGAAASRRLHAERTEPQTQLSTEDNVGVIVITILLRADQPGLKKRNDSQP